MPVLPCYPHLDKMAPKTKTLKVSLGGFLIRNYARCCPQPIFANADPDGVYRPLRGLKFYAGHHILTDFCFGNMMPYPFDYLIYPYYPAYTMGCYQIVIRGDSRVNCFFLHSIPFHHKVQENTSVYSVVETTFIIQPSQ